jgi:hypothetical protein
MSDMTTPTEPFPTPTPPAPRPDWLILVRGLAGAVAGAIAGYLLFWALAKNGMYGEMILGVFLGVGAGWAARSKSLALGVLCAALALPLSIVAEWSVAPFIKDKSLTFFLMNVTEVRPVALIFIGLGSAAAFWFGKGR